jgi:signal recognition particle receptor subunit beta
LQSISDPTGRTLFFDRLVAKVSNVVFQVYTVAGHQRHVFQRQTVLKGTDALVFFWDSNPLTWNENITSMKELMQMYGAKILPHDRRKTPPEVPLVLCANNRDLPVVTPIQDIKIFLKVAGLANTVIFETVAVTGTNVKRAFVFATRECVLRHYQKLRSGLTVECNSETSE